MSRFRYLFVVASLALLVCPELVEALPTWWSSYWYNGKIYANDIVRGVDSFQFSPVPAGVMWNHLNAQTQMGNTLPPPPIGSVTPVARLIAPPFRNAQPGPGGFRPARAFWSRATATARGRGWLSRSHARASKRR